MTLGSIPFSSPALADDRISLDAKNLICALHFTPLLIEAEDRDACLFHGGETASPEWQAMAARGVVSGRASNRRQDPVAQLTGIMR